MINLCVNDRRINLTLVKRVDCPSSLKVALNLLLRMDEQERIPAHLEQTLCGKERSPLMHFPIYDSLGPFTYEY